MHDKRMSVFQGIVVNVTITLLCVMNIYFKSAAFCLHCNHLLKQYQQEAKWFQFKTLSRNSSSHRYYPPIIRQWHFKNTVRLFISKANASVALQKACQRRSWTKAVDCLFMTSSVTPITQVPSTTSSTSLRGLFYVLLPVLHETTSWKQ